MSHSNPRKDLMAISPSRLNAAINPAPYTTPDITPTRGHSPMTHYWLSDRKTGAQYIYNPGQPDHGSLSTDGINWGRPIDDDHLAQRQITMDEIMVHVAHEHRAALQPKEGE